MAAEPSHHSVWPEGRPFSLGPCADTLWGDLAATAERFPDKPGLVFYDTVVTFAEMVETAEALAGFLVRDCGVKPGDRVMLQLQSTPQFVLAYQAILRAGAVVVPVNPMNRTGELRHLCEDCDARTIFVAQDGASAVVPLVEEGEIDTAILVTYSDYVRVPTRLSVPDFVAAQPLRMEGPGWVAWNDALAADRRPPEWTGKADDLAVLPYTSGSTGKPKGCLHTHATTLHSVRSITDWFGFDADDVFLAVAPLFHVTGMQTAMNAPIRLGATTVMMPRWDRAAAADLIERFRVSVWPSIPTMAVDLLALPGIEKHDLSSIRVMFGGGVAMPEAVAARLKEICGITFLEGYGMTETMAPITANPPQAPKRQCGGIPVFDTEVKILRPAETEEMPAGEVGEVVVAGPQLFHGYWRQPDPVAAGFVTLDGRRFFRTGDLGRLDEEGYLFLVDRLKRMINVAGYKVWPAEVEAMLYAHPAIREVCVIGAPDARSGEIVKAWVVPRDGATATPEEIVAWARTVMSAYKAPRIVAFTDALPRSGTGKIQWLTLQEHERASASAT